MKRDYPTNVDNFRKSNINDTERLINLQSHDECDSIVISRYSLSFLSTQIQSSCDRLYPLYDEDLFTQEVIVAVSQTLGELGDELINIMDIMASKNLYRESHDYAVSKLDEGCEFQALNDRKGVAWKSFFSPLVFSAALAVIAFIVGCMKYKNGQTSNQSESSSPQCTAEPEEELISLLDHSDDLNKFASEVKRLNEESEERITERIIQNVETSIMKRITVDNERVMKRLHEESEERVAERIIHSERVMKRLHEESEERVAERIINSERVMKQFNEESEGRILNRVTADNECVIKLITECIERNSKHIKLNE